MSDKKKKQTIRKEKDKNALKRLKIDLGKVEKAELPEMEEIDLPEIEPLKIDLG